MRALELIKSTQGLSLSLKEKVDNMLPSASPIDHLANMINLVAAEIKSIKSHELKLAAERKSLEAMIEQAEGMVLEEMQVEGVVEMSGQLVKYVTRQNPWKLIIEDEELIPESFKKPVTKSVIQNDMIKTELIMGNTVPGCRVERSISLQLKANTGV